MSRFGVSASSMDLSHQEENKRRTLGLKLKNSYSKSTHETTHIQYACSIGEGTLTSIDRGFKERT
jgi:hypothetical protein